jgi:small subunit ribosomal protein S9
MADEPQDTPQDEPAPEQPTAEQPAAEEPEAPAEPESGEPEADAPAEDAPVAEDAPAEEAAAEDVPAEDAPAEDAAPVADADAAADAEAAEPPAEKPKPKRKKEAKADEPDVIPGAHLEPDLVLEEEKKRSDESGYAGAEAEAVAETAVDGEAPIEGAADSDEEETPGPLEAVLDLAADARYRATGKRKSAVARVTLKPGTGEYTINGKTLNEYFPRATLQTKARHPLEIVGQQDRMDVVAKIHGGGVSAQAGALRHGITRALVEADPNLRGELKRRGFLTRDPRVKERKKAGLKKARKRPQFSKR